MTTQQINTALDPLLVGKLESEPPITDEEERLIGEVAGHLFDRAEANRGNALEQTYADEHDAVMRLRRRLDVVEAALASLSA